MNIINSCQCDVIDEINRFKSVTIPSGDEVNTVKCIIGDVCREGDSALVRYTEKFDGVSVRPDDFRVSATEVEAAYSLTRPGLIRSIHKAIRNIERFQNHIKIQNPPPFSAGVSSFIETCYDPVACAGVYIPGGAASYPSTVLMNAIPARVAGVKRIVMVSPPCKDGNIAPERLVAARESGVDEIYKIGGAQAVAALAFGTETIPKVDKIVGPGNMFVAAAKREVYGHVGIDIIAGPSEVLILADEGANPMFVAYDMVSQAEHGPGVAVLVTSSSELIDAVLPNLNKIADVSRRADAVKDSLKRFGLIVKVQNEDEMVRIANEFAPEHLEVMVSCPANILSTLKNVGVTFVGDYSPVALGDYIAGPSHVLPTGGTSRFSSGLSVNDFLVRRTTISYSQDAFRNVAPDIIEIATSEGLYAHADSVLARTESA